MIVDHLEVCDRCKENKPVYIIPKDRGIEGCRVFCEECARRYYGIERRRYKCKTCGKEISEDIWIKDSTSYKYCSVLCAIKAFYSSYDDSDQPRFFSKDDDDSD